MELKIGKLDLKMFREVLHVIVQLRFAFLAIRESGRPIREFKHAVLFPQVDPCLNVSAGQVLQVVAEGLLCSFTYDFYFFLRHHLVCHGYFPPVSCF
ncbi:hypothetical protein D3C76_1551440 [compost metagenome]